MRKVMCRMTRPETRRRMGRAGIALLFTLIFCLGLWTVDDYGRCWDEKGEINIYRMALMEYGEILPFETGFHQALSAMGVTPLSQSIEMDHNSSAYYPLAPLACDPNVTEQQMTHWWRVWTWALFTLGLYALYAICRRMGLPRLLAAAVVLLALCCPRLFAQGHYNNKDAALMDLTAVVLWQSLRLREKPTTGRALCFALAAGFCTNTRIIGGAVSALCGGMALLSLIVEKRFTRRTWRAVLVAALGALGCYVLLTPALLRDPAGYLTYVLRNSYSFSRWNGALLFCGRVIDLSWQRPPFYYLPVMIALTMPLVQMGLILAGGALTLRRCFRQKLEVLRGQESLAAVLSLSCWLLPLLGMMAMRVRVYNGWRHAYFLFFPMMATAGWTLNRIRLRLAAKKLPRRLGAGALAALLAVQGAGLALNHPFQFAYYQPLVSRDGLEQRHELDYWNVGIQAALEWLEENAPAGQPIRVTWTDRRTRSGVLSNLALWPEERRARFVTMEPNSEEDASAYRILNTSYAVLAGEPLPAENEILCRFESYGSAFCFVCTPKEAVQP